MNLKTLEKGLKLQRLADKRKSGGERKRDKLEKEEKRETERVF